ncbi:Fur family transcriptional regulator [Rhodococcus sp. IEGM 1408]|uniref:Fur family transcriptional regulator n=1 Tax=Rhodococcus sp. IEGM 1408 TaxID=3082220 RepID=UPI002955C4BB|nr:Fur family transcriptional regulator [Rhodococcus sp. IEGM 1408]MDV8000939.1 Fur family transcriptional regulator [Rhodococcus sp. IEGM 1408]
MTGRHEAHHVDDPVGVVSQALATLRNRGERVTRARLRLLHILAERHDHLTAEELASLLHGEGIHRATVYRTLELLVGAGTVTHRQLPGGATAYHIATSNHLHGHCVSCGGVVALPVDTLDPVVERLRVGQGFEVDPNRSSLVGTCRDCRDPVGGGPG